MKALLNYHYGAACNREVECVSVRSILSCVVNLDRADGL